MELKRPVARPTYNPPPSILPKRIRKEEHKPTINSINSVDDAISFFSKQIDLDSQLLNILCLQRYNEGIYALSNFNKLDLLSILTKATSVAELQQLNLNHPPRDWSKAKLYVPK